MGRTRHRVVPAGRGRVRRDPRRLGSPAGCADQRCLGAATRAVVHSGWPRRGVPHRESPPSNPSRHRPSALVAAAPRCCPSRHPARLSRPWPRLVAVRPACPPGLRSVHRGVDLAVPVGTPVCATGPGRVVAAGVRSGYGLAVEVGHAGGAAVFTLYAHLDAVPAGVRVGTVVRRGTFVGWSGASVLAPASRRGHTSTTRSGSSALDERVPSIRFC